MSEMAEDPFAPENVGTVNFILNQRIYDVLCGIFMHLNSPAAGKLMEIHAGGDFLATSPQMSGVFIGDEMREANGE